MSKGFNCQKCGKYWAFDAYVSAHSRDVLVHHCDCGAKHNIVMFTATLVKEKKSKKKKPE